MNRNVVLPLGLLLAAFSVALSVASCSGPLHGTGGCVSNCGGQTKPFTVTMIAEPESDPTAFTVLAFSAQITGLTLNESNGTAVPLSLAPSPYPVDFNRLVTDTVVLATSASIPASTAFNSMTMAVSNIELTIANGPTAIGSCNANQVCQFTPAPSNATITTTLFPGGLTPGADGKVNIYLHVNEQVIVTSSGSAITVNFASSQNNLVGSFFLPRKSSCCSASGPVDLVQDFTGQVTAVSATSITVTTGIGTAFTAAINSSTKLDVPQPTLCTAATIATCVIKGTFVSLDATIASGGAATATEIDLLDNASTTVDAVEGVLFNIASGGTGFSLVVTDKQVVTGNATLTAAAIGDIFTVTLDPAATFQVDTKNLTNQSPAVPTANFAGTGDLLSGQTVRLHVKAGTASGSRSTNNQVFTADEVQLRFTRISGGSGPSSSSILQLANTNQLYGTSTGGTQFFQVQTYSGITQYDNGITSNSDIGGLGSSNFVAMRALYIRNATNFWTNMVRSQ